MDKEAIATSVRYEQLREQHFSGGYYSESVKAQAETFKTLSVEEKQTFYADAFNAVHSAAKQLLDHLGVEPAFGEQTAEVDLKKEGLSTFTVGTVLHSEQAAELDLDEIGYIPPYLGVSVYPDAFEPVPRRKSEYINAPGDDLGLETSGPTMVTLDNQPDHWGEPIYANLDGTFLEDSDFYELDTEIMRLLDAQETLSIVSESLGLPKPSAA